MEIFNLSINDSNEENKTAYLYTGTSCMNLEGKGVKSSVCICTNEDENQTIIELLDDHLSTNQKAELHAIYRALSIIVDEQNIFIVSRSDYAVKCITDWSDKWKENEWKKTPKKSVQNIEIIQDVLELLEELLSKGKRIDISHSNNIPNKQGNSIAQRFAKQALTQYSSLL